MYRGIHPADGIKRCYECADLRVPQSARHPVNLEHRRLTHMVPGLEDKLPMVYKVYKVEIFPQAADASVQHNMGNDLQQVRAGCREWGQGCRGGKGGGQGGRGQGKGGWDGGRRGVEGERRGAECASDTRMPRGRSFTPDHPPMWRCPAVPQCSMPVPQCFHPRQHCFLFWLTLWKCHPQCVATKYYKGVTFP